jgi:Ser/Thr protein kinase RdoA (MazF antagonist)
MDPGQTTPIDHGRIAREHFGIDGTVVPLPGYEDTNARIESADGQRFVLRVSPPHPNIGRLRFVNEAMNAAKSASFDAPSSIPTKSGDLLAVLPGDRVARLLTWVHGVTADDAGRPDAAAPSVGRTAAEMLEVFEPLRPAYDRTFYLWDPGRSLQTIANHRNHVTDLQQRSLVDRVLSNLRRVPYDGLPVQVIHSDLNAGNLVLSGMSVSGVIDFEDVAMTIRIGELSVACAYAMLGQDDPVSVAMDVIGGYLQITRVTELEATHLFVLTLSRMAVSVSVAASQPPGNPHQHHISGIMWDLLTMLLDRDIEALSVRFKEAALS